MAQESLMRATLLEALLSVQLMRQSVQQGIRDLSAEPSSAGGQQLQGTHWAANRLELSRGDEDSPAPPSPEKEHFCSNVLFQNVLFQDAWASQDEGPEHRNGSHQQHSHEEGPPHKQPHSSPMLAHTYSPASALSPSPFPHPQQQSGEKSRHHRGSTPLRSALNKLNVRGEGNVINSAFGLESPPQAERDFQRSARSSMDAGAFFSLSTRQPPSTVPHSSYDYGSRHQGRSAEAFAHDQPARPSARKNLAASLGSEAEQAARGTEDPPGDGWEGMDVLIEE